MFEELLRRLPDIELAGPVDRLRSSLIIGIKRMPVAFTPERQRNVVGG
jgi:cholest-4-en-3-one 26-monooxygenase